MLISEGSRMASILPAQLPHSDRVEEDAVILQRAVKKLALFGQRVGVTPEEMISLLESGCSVHDLLAVVASTKSAVA